MKADCNVSLDGGARVEVKNVNSARNVERALTYEVARQQKEGAVRETRHFDEASGRTSSSRAKETAADYRFLIDPDLRPVDVLAITATMSPEEGPLARRQRIAGLAGVQAEDASPLFEERALADLYESVHDAEPRVTFTLLVRDVRAELEFRKTTLAAAGVPMGDLVALTRLRGEGKILPQVATRLLRYAFDHRGLGDALATELGTSIGGDQIVQAARGAVMGNPKAVADYRAGKPTAINFLVGQAFRALKGRGDPGVVKDAVERALLET
jgi:aspartyl-tRNA(Asn)/glutamyl-tRNA(Gln) amidotransferase subunit B